MTRLVCCPRTTSDLHNLLASLDQKGVGFRRLAQADVNTTVATGILTLAILGAVASFEFDLRATRQLEGIRKSRTNYGKYVGMRSSIDYAQMKRFRSRESVRPKSWTPRHWQDERVSSFGCIGQATSAIATSNHSLQHRLPGNGGLSKCRGAGGLAWVCLEHFSASKIARTI